ncbi:MAG: phage tail tape measure C-terminal domain-containing protein [Pseudomonadota bacterium]
MSETPRTQSVDTDLAESATTALAPLSDAVEASFVQLSQSIGEELARLSVDGRLSVRGMVDDILQDLARLAAQEIIGRPLQRALGREDSGLAANAVQTLLKRSIRNG